MNEQFEATKTERSARPQGETVRRQPRPAADLLAYLKQYAREKPEIAALTCFGVGFLLGWKLKPW